MKSVVQLPDLVIEFGESGLVEFEDHVTWNNSYLMWRLVLAMAMRDGASSVHYHPWRSDGHMSYIVAGTRYEILEPPPKFAAMLAEVAESLASASWFGRIARGWRGRTHLTAGKVRLNAVTGESDWAVVVWTIDAQCGVEWYRLDPTIFPAPKCPIDTE